MKTFIVMVDDDSYDLPDLYGPFNDEVAAYRFADAYSEGFGGRVEVIPTLDPNSVVINSEGLVE